MNFIYSSKDFTILSTFREEEMSSKFDKRLRGCWHTAMVAGHFKYTLHISKNRFLPGPHMFFAQLNFDRVMNRRAPQNITSMSQPNKTEDFNFTKVNKSEVMFKLIRDGSIKATNPDVMLINVSPLEYGHSLLVPELNSRLPQVLTLRSICLALELVMISKNPNIRIGFNSLLGLASVNHLHLHVYYLQPRMLLEFIKVKHLAGPCFEMTEYPAMGFVFQLVTTLDVDIVSRQVMKLADMLQSNKIAHNLYVTRGTKLNVSEANTYDAIRIYVWARTPTTGTKEPSHFNIGLCELFGHLTVGDSDFFDQLDENFVLERLSETCAATFHSVRDRVKTLFEMESC